MRANDDDVGVDEVNGDERERGERRESSVDVKARREDGA